MEASVSGVFLSPATFRKPVINVKIILAFVRKEGGRSVTVPTFSGNDTAEPSSLSEHHAKPLYVQVLRDF